MRKFRYNSAKTGKIRYVEVEQGTLSANDLLSEGYWIQGKDEWKSETVAKKGDESNNNIECNSNINFQQRKNNSNSTIEVYTVLYHEVIKVKIETILSRLK